MNKWENSKRPVRNLLDKEGQLGLSTMGRSRMENEKKRLTNLIFARAVVIVKWRKADESEV